MSAWKERILVKYGGLILQIITQINNWNHLLGPIWKRIHSFNMLFIYLFEQLGFLNTRPIFIILHFIFFEPTGTQFF
jgi:hypothetical protein